MLGDELEKLYEVFKWNEDLFDEKGKARYAKVYNEISKVLEHKWIQNLVNSKNRLSVLDLCGGTGIAGIAFSEKLKEIGKNTELTIVDLRKSALEKAKEFGKLVLNAEPNVISQDARKLSELSIVADLVLLWGFTTPHFNPWDLIKVYSSLSKLMNCEGVLVVEESDRFGGILSTGYRDILGEYYSKDHFVVTIHSSHDVVTGFTERIAVDLITREISPMKLYFWDIASSAAMAWMFFYDVDFIQSASSKMNGYIVAYRPRKTIDPSLYLSQEPSILKKEQK
ncbi:MAG: methyltransferase domain-containing protein [Thermoproteota archaeon]